MRQPSFTVRSDHRWPVLHWRLLTELMPLAWMWAIPMRIPSLKAVTPKYLLMAAAASAVSSTLVPSSLAMPSAPGGVIVQVAAVEEEQRDRRVVHLLDLGGQQRLARVDVEVLDRERLAAGGEAKPEPSWWMMPCTYGVTAPLL